MTVPRIPSPVTLNLAVSVRQAGTEPTVRSTLTSVRARTRVGGWRIVSTPQGRTSVSVRWDTSGTTRLETVKVGHSMYQVDVELYAGSCPQDHF